MSQSQVRNNDMPTTRNGMIDLLRRGIITLFNLILVTTVNQAPAQTEEDDQVLRAQQDTVDPMPYAAGHWHGDQQDEGGLQAQATETQQAPAQASSANTPIDFKKLKKTELVAECKKRGLSRYGNKPDLIKRLEKSKDSPSAPKFILDAIAKKSEKLPTEIQQRKYAKVKNKIDSNKAMLKEQTIGEQKVIHAAMIAKAGGGWATWSDLYGLYVQYPELKDNFNEYKDDTSFKASCRESVRGHTTYGSERSSKHLGKVQPGSSLKHQRKTNSSDKLIFFAPIDGVYMYVKSENKMNLLLNETAEWYRQQAEDDVKYD